MTTTEKMTNIFICCKCNEETPYDYGKFQHPTEGGDWCVDCMEEQDLHFCEECEKFHEEYYFNEDKNICNECCENIDDCVKCASCDEYISIEDNNVNKKGESVCGSCYLQDENTFILDKEDIDKNKVSFNIYESGGQYEYKDDIINIVIDTYSKDFGEIELKHFFKTGDRKMHRGYGREKLLFFIKYLSDNVKGIDDVSYMKLVTLEQEKKADALRLKKYYNSYGFRKYDEFKLSNGKMGFHMRVNFKSFLKKYIW